MPPVSIKTIGVTLSVKVNGPDQYESRSFEFSAYADLNAQQTPRGREVLGLSIRDEGELEAATQELLDYVKGTLKDMVAPYMDYRARMRRSALEEVRRALPRDLQHLVGIETTIMEDD